MNCKIVSGINLLKSFKGKDYEYILFDINSLTIVPYLNSTKYVSSDRINITPFIETFKLYLSYKKRFPSAKFIFIFDGGISPVITKLLPNYKKKRQSRKYTAINRTTAARVYDYNILLIDQLFDLFNETTICDINRNEADFILGYLVDDLAENGKCLVVSHDKDLLYTFNKDENVDVLYKQTASKNNKTTWFLVDNQDCLNHIIDFQYLKNVNELLYFRALVGDSSDEIPRPFGLKSSKIVKNMFEDAYMYEKEINYNFIIEYFSVKFKGMNPEVIKRFKVDFRRNLLIMNIFNKEVISDNEKISLNSYLNEIKYDISKDIEINIIYDFFDKYGLYLTKEDLDKTFKYLKGVI